VYSPEPLYVLDKRADSNAVIVGPRAALNTKAVALRGVRLHRDGRRVNAVKLRYRSRALRASVPGAVPAGRHRRVTVELAEGVDGAAPGQLGCLLEGELVIGWGTISRLDR
jgi:tRNA-specific 2-thiouridylase